MLKVAYIGNRNNIIDKLLDSKSVKLVKAFIIGEELYLNYKGDPVFDMLSSTGEIDKINNYVKVGDFDILISGGCSYILPVDDYPKNKIYINTHPSALPYGKGRHPINEALLSSHRKMGVTVHYLTAGLDAGDVIEQESFELSDDVDASLLYSFIFELESELLIKAINKIISNDLKYVGVAQVGAGSYYTRPKSLDVIDIASIDVSMILKLLRAFSSDNLGVNLVSNDKTTYSVFSGLEVKNKYISSRYNAHVAGDVCIESNGVLLLKLSDGLLYCKNWKRIGSL